MLVITIDCMKTREVEYKLSITHVFIVFIQELEEVLLLLGFPTPVVRLIEPRDNK